MQAFRGFDGPRSASQRDYLNIHGLTSLTIHEIKRHEDVFSFQVSASLSSSAWA